MSSESFSAHSLHLGDSIVIWRNFRENFARKFNFDVENKFSGLDFFYFVIYCILAKTSTARTCSCCGITEILPLAILYSRHEKHYSFAYYSFVPLVSGSRMKLPLPTTKTSDSCSTHPRRGFCSSFALLFLKALCCYVLISCYFVTIISYKSVCAIACYQNLIKKWGETLKKVAELFQTKQVFECFELWFTTTHQPTKLV